MQLFHRESRPIAERLMTYPTFAGCDLDDLVALVEVGQTFEAPAQWVMMSEGIPADAIYIITEGTAGVYRGQAIVATIGPGEIVGEMAFLSGRQRRATVTSQTAIAGVRIEHEWLERLLPRRPRLQQMLHTVFRSHLPTAAAAPTATEG